MAASPPTSNPSLPRRKTGRSGKHEIVPRGSAPESDGHASRQQRRVPSAQAAYALDSFARLYSFFGRDMRLASALGWDEATVAAWRTRDVVRPQVKKVAQVRLLLELCEETRPYMREDRQVGSWVSTGLPNLHGVTPAQWLATHGRRGLHQLIYGLVDWMPRLPAGEIEPAKESAASQAVAAHAGTAGTTEFRQMLDDLG